MPVENANGIIQGLNASWPLEADPKSEGDDHFRMMKDTLKRQFPGVGGQGLASPITATENDLNATTGASDNFQSQITGQANSIALLDLTKPVAYGRMTTVLGSAPTRNYDTGISSIQRVNDAVFNLNITATARRSDSLVIIAQSEFIFAPAWFSSLPQSATQVSIECWYWTGSTVAALDTVGTWTYRIYDVG